SDKTARVWDAGTGRELQRFEEHAACVTCGAFTPDGRRALTLGRDQVLRLWNVEDGQVVRRYKVSGGQVDNKGVADWVALSKDGRRALSTHLTEQTLILWDVDTGRELDKYRGPGHLNMALISPDGLHAACGSARGVELFDLRTSTIDADSSREPSVV